METKKGLSTSEWLALVAGIIAAVVPVILEKIPPESTAAVILGVLATIAAYILGRSYVKGKASAAEALVAASTAGVVDPPKPPQP